MITTRKTTSKTVPVVKQFSYKSVVGDGPPFPAGEGYIASGTDYMNASGSNRWRDVDWSRSKSSSSFKNFGYANGGAPFRNANGGAEFRNANGGAAFSYVDGNITQLKADLAAAKARAAYNKAKANDSQIAYNNWYTHIQNKCGRSKSGCNDEDHAYLRTLLGIWNGFNAELAAEQKKISDLEKRIAEMEKPVDATKTTIMGGSKSSGVANTIQSMSTGGKVGLVVGVLVIAGIAIFIIRKTIKK